LTLTDRAFMLEQAGRTGALLVAHWGEVLELAAHLERRGTMSCDAARAVIDQAPPAAAPRWHRRIATALVDFVLDKRFQKVLAFGVPPVLSA
jgi:hypothetical protein